LSLIVRGLLSWLFLNVSDCIPLSSPSPLVPVHPFPFRHTGTSKISSSPPTHHPIHCYHLSLPLPSYCPLYLLLFMPQILSTLPLLPPLPATPHRLALHLRRVMSCRSPRLSVWSSPSSTQVHHCLSNCLLTSRYNLLAPFLLLFLKCPTTSTVHGIYCHQERLQ
jgi:hypothetical protein